MAAGPPHQVERLHHNIVYVDSLMLYCDDLDVEVIPEEERKSISKQYEELNSYKKVAKLYGISANTVRKIVLLTRSKKKLGRKSMSPCGKQQQVKTTGGCNKKKGGRVRDMCYPAHEMSTSAVRGHPGQGYETAREEVDTPSSRGHSPSDIDNGYSSHTFTGTLEKVQVWDKLSLVPFLAGRLMHFCYEYFFSSCISFI